MTVELVGLQRRPRKCRQQTLLPVPLFCLLVAAAACRPTDRQSGPPPSVTTYCDQTLLHQSAGFAAPQTLSPNAPGLLLTHPIQSILPPSEPQSAPDLGAFATLIVSRDCNHGYSVTVSAGPYVRTVAVARDRLGHAIAAIVFGLQIGHSPVSTRVVVTAYDDRREVGTITVHF